MFLPELEVVFFSSTSAPLLNIRPSLIGTLISFSFLNFTTIDGLFPYSDGVADKLTTVPIIFSLFLTSEGNANKRKRAQKDKKINTPADAMEYFLIFSFLKAT